MSTFNSILCKRFVCTTRCKEFVSLIHQHTGRIHHIGFLFHCSRRQQNILLRNTIAHGKHRFEYGTGSIHSDTTHFTGRSHIYSQHRIGLLQAVEGELGSLDSHIIQFEEILFRFLYRQTEHYFRCQLDKVDLQHFADKRERTTGTQITFNHLDIVVFRQILNIKRTGDIQSLSNLTADTLNTANSFYIQLLRWELNCCIAGMYSRKFDMLTYSVCYNFSILRHRIHFHFLGVFDKLAYYHRMFLRYISCQFQETFQFFLVGTNIHRSSRKHIRRTNKYGETYLFNELLNVIHRS